MRLLLISAYGNSRCKSRAMLTEKSRYISPDDSPDVYKNNSSKTAFHQWRWQKIVFFIQSVLALKVALSVNRKRRKMNEIWREHHVHVQVPSDCQKNNPVFNHCNGTIETGSKHKHTIPVNFSLSQYTFDKFVWGADIFAKMISWAAGLPCMQIYFGHRYIIPV